MAKVYGVDVHKRAAVPAANFMHTQSAICGCSMLSGIISLIFTLVMLGQMKPVLDLQAKTTAAGMPSQEQLVEKIVQKAWISALSHLCMACIFGSIVVAIGRNFIETRNSRGMKLCCIADGLYAGCGFCQSCIGCFTFIALCAFVGAMSDAPRVCASISSASASLSTTAAPLAAGVKPTLFATTASCQEIVTAFKGPALTFVIWVGTLVASGCCISSICGAGAKFASETEQAFDDEEYGEMVQDSNDYY